MKIHTIGKIQRQVQPVEVAESFADDVAGWLSSIGETYGLTTLLAHADDGVIWGRVEGGRLRTAHDVFTAHDASAALRPPTLQQARLFGVDGELLVWRADESWQARLVLGSQGDWVEAYDEWQILWGTRAESKRDGFTLVAEGAQGLRHAPPVELDAALFAPEENRHPLRLQVRHYLETEPSRGLLRFTLSRLVRVTDETQAGKEQGQ